MAIKYLDELKIRQVNSEGTPEIHQLKLRSGALDMDVVIDSGSNSNGNWEKWSNGKLVQWGVKSFTHSVTAAWGSLFASTDACTVNFPIPFIATPTFISSPRTTSSNSAFFGNYGTPSINATRATNVTALFRPTSNENVPFVVHWTATGRWK